MATASASVQANVDAINTRVGGAIVGSGNTTHLNGVKEAFANWVSNITPEETPFYSMIGKEGVKNTLFQWQTDELDPTRASGGVAEGAAAGAGASGATDTKVGWTEIFKRVVETSGSSNAVEAYGRGKELAYQLEKGAKELKLLIEQTMLTAQAGAGGVTRTLTGYEALHDATLAVTGTAGSLTDPAIMEDDLWALLTALYKAGGNPTTLMYAPDEAVLFTKLLEKVGTNGATRVRMFRNDNMGDFEVTQIVSPLGQNLKLVVNRQMTAGKIYAFNPADFTSMVLRSPLKEKLAKDGDTEKHQIITELGLRLRNPFSAATLTLQAVAGP